MIRGWINWFGEVNQRYGRFMHERAQVKTLDDLIFWLVAFGSFWLLVWNTDVLEPWTSELFTQWFGWEPSDLPSEGKMRWRRMWSTAICLTGMVSMTGLYLRNMYEAKKRRGK
ncbi:hypothetical protein J2X09_003973 [Hydrogenophaga laconesensis]|uniref:Uncharacterized protein n=1 Tax=Hydrogenophaga laconesensis TaxID=1805971 RepID=A0ABU1VFH7_9BURK|nr:hypothetical protein [Hydrogenophaga laconesensis]